MADQKIFAGMAVKNEISIGNVIVGISMLAAVIGFGVSLRADIDQNSATISQGILPEAQKRLTALETQVKIEITGLRNEINHLRQEISLLRAALKRSENGAVAEERKG